MRQKIIVVEGLDGSGKATQAKLLLGKLKKEGYMANQVSFPDYDSPSSSLVKMYLACEFGMNPNDVNAYAASSFYAVDRYASSKKNWQHDWENGIIIADRYTTSNAIHQCSKLDRSEWDTYLNWLFDYEYNLLGIPTPDLVIFLTSSIFDTQKITVADHQSFTRLTAGSFLTGISDIRIEKVPQGRQICFQHSYIARIAEDDSRFI